MRWVVLIGFGVWEGLADGFQASWSRSGFSFWGLGWGYGKWYECDRLGLGVMGGVSGLGFMGLHICDGCMVC